MNLEVLIDKNACFYFWVQAVSGWDPHLISQKTLLYYTDGLSEKHRPVLDKIKQILQDSKQPRGVLSDLYSSNLTSPAAKEITEEAKILVDIFEPFWEEALPYFQETQALLKGDTLAKFTEPMEKAVGFFDSSFSTRDTHSLYLVQNMPDHNAWGLSISKNNLIMIAPSRLESQSQLRNTICIIAHEYIHAIEFESSNSRTLISQSYNKYIAPHRIPHPAAYEWKMMYVEALAYCFASPSIGGYMRPELFDKARPVITEMEDGFWRLVEKKAQTTEHVINWVALSILPNVEEYIKESKKIDQHIVDEIGRLFAEFYLTHPI